MFRAIGVDVSTTSGASGRRGCTPLHFRAAEGEPLRGDLEGNEDACNMFDRHEYNWAGWVSEWFVHLHDNMQSDLQNDELHPPQNATFQLAFRAKTSSPSTACLNSRRCSCETSPSPSPTFDQLNVGAVTSSFTSWP